MGNGVSRWSKVRAIYMSGNPFCSGWSRQRGKCVLSCNGQSGNLAGSDRDFVTWRLSPPVRWFFFFFFFACVHIILLTNKFFSKHTRRVTCTQSERLRVRTRSSGQYLFI